MTFHRILLSVVSLVALVGLPGCGGGSGGDHPETHPASGAVTLDGSPLENAVVTLRPTASDGRGASGRTDAEGKFVLTTFTSGDGARPGSYRVKIVQNQPVQENVEIDIDSSMEATAGAGAGEDWQSELPEKYTSPETSGLEVEITPGENELDFSLSS